MPPAAVHNCLEAQPAAYRHMHKEFNRVDLMRMRGRREEAVDAEDQLLSPSQSMGQSRCIDGEQRGVVLAP